MGFVRMLIMQKKIRFFRNFASKKKTLIFCLFYISEEIRTLNHKFTF
jgi:hypothetical protein